MAFLCEYVVKQGDDGEVGDFVFRNRSKQRGSFYTTLGKPHSDGELESVSPVDYMSGRNTEEHSGVSSSVSTTSGGVYPPSSLLLEIETESGECGEGEMSSLTPCNASPSLS